jgi:hypothetical protein
LEYHNEILKKYETEKNIYFIHTVAIMHILYSLQQRE